MLISQDKIIEAEELLKSGEGSNPFITKMERLRADLQTFKEDLGFINSSIKPPVIIYACDYTEVSAYQKPEAQLVRYLYDVEETAELTPAKKEYNEKKYNDKVIKRWYRLRELFFNSKIPVIIFPSHMREVEDDILYLTQVLNEPAVKLSEIVHLVKSKQVNEADLSLAKIAITKIEKGDNLTDAEAESLSEFFKFFSSNLASRTFDKKIEAGTRLERLLTLLSRGNIEGVDSFNWERDAGVDFKTAQDILGIDLKNLSSQIDQIDHLFSLFGNRSSQANYVDAQALVYTHEINSVLAKNGFANVRVQLVSSSLSMFSIERAILTGQHTALVRHPKILGSLLNARESIWQQVQEDHACLINALDVYLDRLKQKNFKSSEPRQLRHQISEAWQRIESVIFAKEIEENLEKKRTESIAIRYKNG